MARIPFKHQEEMIEYGVKNGSGLIHAGPRVGKTLTSIRIAKKINEWPCLIICPKIAKEGWKDELNLDGVPEDLITVLNSKWTKKRRQKFLDQKKPIVIMNYEQCITHDIFNFRRWKIIIADEIHRIKSPDTSICRYFMMYADQFLGEQHRFGLTGTPASESPLNMVSQHIWAFGNFMGYDNYPEYYFENWRFNQKIYKDLPKKVNHKKEMKKYNSEKAFCITMDDIGLGSEILQARRIVPVNKEQLKQFELVKERTTVETTSGTKLHFNSMARSALDRKVSAGLTCEGFDIISDEKIKDLIEIYQDNGNPMVVAGYYVNQLKHCEYLMKKADIKCGLIYSDVSDGDRNIIIKSFQSGKIDVIIGQIEMISEALDFSRSDDLYIISETLSTKTRTQLEKRITNLNKKNPVTVTTIVTEGTIEAKLSRMIQGKVKVSESMISDIYRSTT